MSSITPALLHAGQGGVSILNNGALTVNGVAYTAQNFNTSGGTPYSLLVSGTQLRFQATNGQNDPDFDSTRQIRTQITGPSFPFFTPVVLELTTNWQANTPYPTTNVFNILAQYHALDNQSPPISIDILPDGAGGEKMQFDYNYQTPNGPFTFANLGSIPFSRNTNYDIQISYTDGHGYALGAVKIVVNGVTEVNSTNIVTGHALAVASNGALISSYYALGFYGGVVTGTPDAQNNVVTVNNPTFSIGATPTIPYSYIDGSIAAPTIAAGAQYPSMLSVYTTRPPWKVAGVDYPVGIPDASKPLINPVTSVPANCTLAGNTLTVNADNVYLNGYDFSKNNGINIVCVHNNLNIINCNFGGTNYKTLTNGVIASSGQYVTIRYCNINGGFTTAGASTPPAALLYFVGSSQQITLQYNYISGCASTVIAMGTAAPLNAQYNFIDNVFVASGKSVAYTLWNSGNVEIIRAIWQFNTTRQTLTGIGAGVGVTFFDSNAANQEFFGISCQYNTSIAPGGTPGNTMSYLFTGNPTASKIGSNSYVGFNYADPSGALSMYQPGTWVSNSTLAVTGPSYNMVTGAVVPPVAPLNYMWQDLLIGGGGYFTGIDVANDGTLVTRVDVYGAYLGSTTPGAPWTQLLTTTALPAPEGTLPFYGAGVEEIRVAPSNSQVLYMQFAPVTNSTAGWWISQNQGAAWTLISPNVAANPNNNATKTHGQKCAIDPINPGVAYLGNANLGFLQVTTNFGATVTNISTSVIPAPTSGFAYYGMAFDPTSGATGGRTNRIIIPVYGKGVWISTNAGSTFIQSSGAPTMITYGCVGPDGTYFCVDNNGNGYNLLSGTWNQIYTPHFQANVIAVDPLNAGHVVVLYAGYPSTTTNGNTASPTWTYGDGDPATLAISSTTIPWLQNSNDKFLSAGGLVFDPNVSGRVWFSQGTCVMYANSVNANPGVTTWIVQSAGQENLVANDICWPPGGALNLVTWDRAFWQITNPNAYQANYGPNYAAEIRLGTSADWAKSTSTFIVAVATTDNNGTLQIYKNASGGAYNAWTLIAAQPATGTIGGQIACASTTAWGFIDNNAGHVYQTQNGGTSWTQPPTLPTTGWQAGYFLCRHVIVADDTSIGTAYAWAHSGGSAPGLYRSTDSFVTWTRAFSGTLSVAGGDQFNACMRQAPGHAGHLFYTNGTQDGPTDAHPVSGNNGIFWRSVNGGTSWTNVSNSSFTIGEVWAFGFSASKPSTGTYPAIMIAGWVNGVWGIWQSDDDCVTWYNIGAFPLTWTDQIKIAGGDPGNWSRWVVGYVGSSYKFYGPGNI